MEQAQQVLMMAMNNPVMQAPVVLKRVTEDLLRAMDAWHLIPLLPTPQEPQQPQEPPMRPAVEENADFLRERDAVPHPDDEDGQHIEEHGAFVQSDAGQMMTKTSKDMVARHMRWHAAQRIQKVTAQLGALAPIGADANGQRDMVGSPGNGSGGLGGLPNDQGFPGMVAGGTPQA
jgi:hypothetical protein